MHELLDRSNSRDGDRTMPWKRIALRTGVVVALALSVAVLVTHAGWSALASLWPFLLILACPLVMAAMMGRGRGRDQAGGTALRSGDAANDQPWHVLPRDKAVNTHRLFTGAQRSASQDVSEKRL